MECGGEGGIRTLGTRKGTTVFETAPFDRSGTSPLHGQAPLFGGGRSNAPGALTEPPGIAKHVPEPATGDAACCRTPPRLHMVAMSEPRNHVFDPAAEVQAPPVAHAAFSIGEVVRHRLFDFRGVIFDIDPVFANSEEWYQAIPEELRPAKDQPFYHLLAENGEASYIAYVSQQNLLPDELGEPVHHPAISGLFDRFAGGRYRLKPRHRH